MDTFWGLSQTAWTGVTALLTAGLLVVAVVAALYAARQVKIAREQAKESRKAGLEASRPYVIVTTVTDIAEDQGAVTVHATATVDRYAHGLTKGKGLAARRLHLELTAVATRT